ncbi:MAG TPA: glycosyl hydrolase 53 family protein, partial [Polyangiaceae bacterium]|nr:glycosyl hydrolase 53 family protein [Polyangiaceae bacterium]
ADIPRGLSSSLRLTLEALDPGLGPVTLGVHFEGPTDSWVKADALELFSGPPEWDEGFLLGGDLSFRRQLDDAGVTFLDAEGNPTEVLEVLSESGFNLARFRLHNDPGSPDHYPSNQFPPGYQNLDDTLANAKGCSEYGLELLVSFHYSDYWTNPGQQYKPYRWEELDEEALETAVYDYTREALEAFREQGTRPYIVTLGNETNAGILWPEGRISSGGANFDGFARLFSAGARAVREVAPDTLIAVHLSEPGSALYEWLGWAQAAELDYDVVGISLYPFWSNLRVDEMRQVVQHSIELTGKRVLVVETGFPWSLERPSGFPTLIASNDLNPQGLETFGVSPRGQELFLRSLFQQLHAIDGVIGASYWDPIWLDTPALPSNVPDTALFDWEGAPLRGLSAFREKYR